MVAGSGTPLAQKLDLKRGMRCWFHNMPDSILQAINPSASEIDAQPTASDGLQCAHLFVTERGALERELAALQPLMQTNGFIWVSWPHDGPISEEAVRHAAQPTGLVDVKACAVDGEWAGLKLMMPKEKR